MLAPRLQREAISWRQRNNLSQTSEFTICPRGDKDGIQPVLKEACVCASKLPPPARWGYDSFSKKNRTGFVSLKKWCNSNRPNINERPAIYKPTLESAKK